MTEKQRINRLVGHSTVGRLSTRSDKIAAFAFIGPSLVGFLLFVIIPAVVGLGLSFYRWDLFSTPEWVGLDNIVRLFGDAQMWQALMVTGQFVLLGVVPTVLLGFVFAVIINTRIRGISVLRVFYFVPMVASAAVAAVLWSYMYHPRSGIINSFLDTIGLAGPAWLSDKIWALPALTVMMTWLSMPLAMILYLAGLQRISQDIYDAAALDGAGWWRRLWSISWPNVAATTILISILQLLNFVSGSFEIALLMTNGGPLNATQSLALYSYKMAFERSDMGYASALALFQLAIIAGAVLAGRAILNRKRTA